MKLLRRKSFDKTTINQTKTQNREANLPLVLTLPLLWVAKAPAVKVIKPLEFDRQFQEQKRSQKSSSEAVVFPTKE